jgi:hypothetical protein
MPREAPPKPVPAKKFVDDDEAREAVGRTLRDGEEWRPFVLRACEPAIRGTSLVE